MKSNLCTVKSGIEQFKLQYSEDLAKLGKPNPEFWAFKIFYTFFFEIIEGILCSFLLK